MTDKIIKIFVYLFITILLVTLIVFIIIFHNMIDDYKCQTTNNIDWYVKNNCYEKYEKGK